MTTPLFISSLPVKSKRASSKVAAKCISRPTISAVENRGFDRTRKAPKRPRSKAEIRREAAATRYDEMAAAGMPEYSIWMRLKEGGTELEEDQMPWLPVGCLSVPRSAQVAEAIFKAEEDLMQGAIRLFPKLQNEERDNIQFGYQLRQFDDEEIRVAERPSVSFFQSNLRKLFGNLQNPLRTQ